MGNKHSLLPPHWVVYFLGDSSAVKDKGILPSSVFRQIILFAEGLSFSLCLLLLDSGGENPLRSL